MTTKVATRKEKMQGASVAQLFTARALATPEAVALASATGALTYGELNARASQLAEHLRSLGVAPDVLVGLCLERSLAFVVGALAILKAGGAYVPLDPAYPAERLAFMLNDAKPPVLVTQQCIADRLPSGAWKVAGLDPNGLHAPLRKTDAPDRDVAADNLAYVIYTSGSTGQPKGVQVTHGNLLNLISWHQRAFGVTAADRATQLASPGFDAAVWEVWPYLTAGASLHLPNDCTRLAPESLRDWLVAQNITISFLPTTLAEGVLKLEWPRETALRFLLTGADTLHNYPRPGLPFALVNNYGPTECTVVTTSATIPPREKPEHLPPIGHPIDNYQVYILDAQMRAVPAGSPGELYVGGAGVARGYLNRADLTAEKFVPSPFEAGARLYRTGDLAKRLPDGQFVFLGRVDEQVKIRGYRVEPHEVAAVLENHPAVQASVVVAQDDGHGGKRLVAYIVPAADSDVTAPELQNFLQSYVPDYMMPAVFVRLDAPPLTPNGKLDRAALPEPDSSNVLRAELYVAPSTPVEERLAEILAPLLNVERVGVNDNFFLLGGHSLLGTQLIARVRDTFGVELPLRTIFDSPALGKLAGEIERLIIAKVEAMSEDEVQQFLQ